MLISVIVPIYKVEKYLNRCVDSIINQDYKDIEIILVDDGSPDNCPRICDEYSKIDSRIIVIHKKNGGSSSARNAGIMAATGEYLMFVDSDDWWNQNVSLKEMIEYVKKNTTTEMFLFTSYDYIEGDGYYKRLEHNNLDSVRTDSVNNYYSDLLKNGNLEIAAFTKIIKKKYIIENSLFFKEGIVTEDSDWMIRSLRVLHDIKIINKPLYIYTFKREGSISNTIKPTNQIDTLNIIKNSFNYWKDQNSSIKDLEFCYCAYLWFSSLAIASKYNKKDFKMIKKYFDDTKEVCKYSNSKKTKLAYRFYRTFGYKITAKAFGFYLSLRGNKLGRTKVEL